MSQVRPSLAAALLLLPLAAGCLDFGGSEASGLITRTVEIRLDADSMADLEESETPDEAFGAVSETRFTYTHAGDSVDPDDVTVRFTGVEGDEVEEPLSEFTPRSSIGDGDTVTIRGAAPYSPITIEGAGVEASRGGSGAEWLRAGGYPLPLAIEPGASAAWDSDLSLSYGLSFDHFLHESTWENEYEECDWRYDESGNYGPTDCHTVAESSRDLSRVDDFVLEAIYALEGGVTVSADGDAQEMDVDFGFEGDSTVSGTARALVEYVSEWTHDGETEGDSWSGPAGFDGQASADGDSLLRLVFEDGALERVGSSASYGTSGHLRLWGENYTEDDPYEPLDPSDWPDSEEVAYDEQEAEIDEDPDEDAVALMESIWDIDLAPGDRFEFLVEADDDEVEFTLALAVAVEAEEELEVAAGTFPALRITSSLELDFDADGASPQHLEYDGMTHWVHAESYLPLRISTDVEEELPTDDLRAMLEDLATFWEDENSRLELPDIIELTTAFEGGLELRALDGDVRMPGLLAGLGLWAPYASVGYGMFGYPLGYGYEDDYGEWEGDDWEGDDWEDDYPEEAPWEVPAFPQVAVEDHPDVLTPFPNDNVLALTHLGGETVYTGEWTWLVGGESASTVDCETGAYVFEWAEGDLLCLAEAGWQATPGDVTLEVRYWDDTVVFQDTAIVL